MSLTEPTAITQFDVRNLNEWFQDVSDADEKARLKKQLIESVDENIGKGASKILFGLIPESAEYGVRFFGGIEKATAWLKDVAFDYLAENGVVNPQHKLTKAVITADVKNSDIFSQVTQKIGISSEQLEKNLRVRFDAVVKSSYGVTGISNDVNALRGDLVNLHKTTTAQLTGALISGGVDRAVAKTRATVATNALIGISLEDLEADHLGAFINARLNSDKSDKLSGFVRSLVEAQKDRTPSKMEVGGDTLAALEKLVAPTAPQQTGAATAMTFPMFNITGQFPFGQLDVMSATALPPAPPQAQAAIR